MEHFVPAPPAAVTRVLMSWDRETLAAFVAVAIDLMDVADGDPDLENDPFNEGEPAFDAKSREMVNSSSICPNGDNADAAWIERVDQTKVARAKDLFWAAGTAEDAEDDDGGGEVTDDEPGFDKRSRRIANASHHKGPGCSISDPDYGAEDVGEADDAEPTGSKPYGVDQTKPISETNPAVH